MKQKPEQILKSGNQLHQDTTIKVSFMFTSTLRKQINSRKGKLRKLRTVQQLVA